MKVRAAEVKPQGILLDICFKNISFSEDRRPTTHFINRGGCVLCLHSATAVQRSSVTNRHFLGDQRALKYGLAALTWDRNKGKHPL